MVIATVFLTIIGMTVGFLLGERHRDRVRASVQTGSETPTTDISSEPSGPLCPDETIRTADSLGLPSDLRQIFKIITDNRTVVWICQDGAGSLYYQSQTKSDQGPLVQGKNGLFLSQVNREGEDEYLATAENGTQFVVNRQQLEVHFADGRKTQVSDVDRVE
ncbi:hypothetical protein Ate02nite_16090 [Paractinoplanes tereljensis]|uniref:Uncharacterized protein n=1 Tax=Paractinoplanes tereljensis TaxID=571912 RepID=A0A919NHQ9_9ACTN|nr:hypothetical protein Ate02nite_16090 [Actinoplanes tereljensis]